MAIKFLVLAGLAAAAALLAVQLAKPVARADRAEFAAFRARFGKVYGSPAEQEFRFQVFSRTVRRVNEVNARRLSYTLAVNKFSDLTFEEFKRFYLSSTVLSNELVREATGPLAKGKKDWRDAKIITPVKDQGMCGSCWAFSAVGSLEAAIALKQKLKKPIDLSAQELVDCSGEQGNEGCNGGLMTYAFDYVKAHKLAALVDYPYTAQDGQCKPNDKKTRYTLASYKIIDKPDVNLLIKTLDTTPVSVAIEVQDDFQSYSSGIYEPEDSDCGQGLNHGVLAVGYDTTAPKPFFIIKNSWSSGWGEKGYIRMAVGKGSGTCGIANKWDAYPIL